MGPTLLVLLDLMCAPGVKHHGASIDLDVKSADIHDVFRLLADVGHVNIVLPDTVSAKVTLKLTHVAWDQVACAVAAVNKLDIDRDGNVLMITPVAARQTPRRSDR
jgi:type IV pilus assembly protein PilQ